jgi:hypothetical protein
VNYVNLLTLLTDKLIVSRYQYFPLILNLQQLTKASLAYLTMLNKVNFATDTLMMLCQQMYKTSYYYITVVKLMNLILQGSYCSII